MSLEIPSTELKVSKTVQAKWGELCSLTLQPKKVNLQPSPSPPPAVPLPQTRDPSPGLQPTESDGVLVNFMGDYNHPDVAFRAARELLPLDNEGKKKKKK